MRFKRAHGVVAVLVTALAMSGGTAGAQETEELREKWFIPYPQGVTIPTFVIAAEKARSAPGTSAGSQSAFGASWGQAYIGAGYQARTRYGRSGRDGMDGAVSTGFGLGNAQRLVGLDVSIASLGTFDNFGDFSFGLKLHRMITPDVAIAVGVENAYIIGTTDSDRSYYIVGSRQFNLGPEPNDPFQSFMVSLGVGNGRYLFEEDFQLGRDKINVFGSIGLRVHEMAGLVADWTGQDLALAVSIVPFTKIPLVITPGLADLTGTAGDGARFTVGTGLSFSVPSFDIP